MITVRSLFTPFNSKGSKTSGSTSSCIFSTLKLILHFPHHGLMHGKLHWKFFSLIHQTLSANPRCHGTRNLQHHSVSFFFCKSASLDPRVSSQAFMRSMHMLQTTCLGWEVMRSFLLDRTKHQKRWLRPIGPQLCVLNLSGGTYAVIDGLEKMNERLENENEWHQAWFKTSGKHFVIAIFYIQQCLADYFTLLALEQLKPFPTYLQLFGIAAHGAAQAKLN